MLSNSQYGSVFLSMASISACLPTIHTILFHLPVIRTISGTDGQRGLDSENAQYFEIIIIIVVVGLPSILCFCVFREK